MNCWQWIDEILRSPVCRRCTQRQFALPHTLPARHWKGVHRVLGLPDEPRMTRFLAPQLGRSHYFDISRARRDFGYRPARFDRAKECSGLESGYDVIRANRCRR